MAIVDLRRAIALSAIVWRDSRMTGYTSPIFNEIGSRFIDVNFENEAADANRALGCNPMTTRDYERLAESGAVQDFPDSELIPESSWDNLIQQQDAAGWWLERRLVEIKDQDGEGSCCANAATTAHQIMQAMAWGDHAVRVLSAISVYRECAPGPNTGSNVGDVMRQMIETGAIPSSRFDLAKADVAAGYYDHTHPDVGYSRRPPVNWDETAANFRVDEWWRLPSLKHVISANLKGFPVVGARDHHCLCFIRWLLRGGKRLFAFAQSWGKWGETLQISTGPAQGFGFDSEAKVAAWASREAWCPRSIVSPSWMK
jgi:hypothetical protein